MSEDLIPLRATSQRSCDMARTNEAVLSDTWPLESVMKTFVDTCTMTV